MEKFNCISEELETNLKGDISEFQYIDFGLKDELFTVYFRLGISCEIKKQLCERQL